MTERQQDRATQIAAAFLRQNGRRIIKCKPDVLVEKLSD
jgi:hypothetical protein